MLFSVLFGSAPLRSGIGGCCVLVCSRYRSPPCGGRIDDGRCLPICWTKNTERIWCRTSEQANKTEKLNQNRKLEPRYLLFRIAHCDADVLDLLAVRLLLVSARSIASVWMLVMLCCVPYFIFFIRYLLLRFSQPKCNIVDQCGKHCASLTLDVCCLDGT